MTTVTAISSRTENENRVRNVLAKIDSGERRLINSHTSSTLEFHGYVIRDHRYISPVFRNQRSLLLGQMRVDDSTGELICSFGYPTDILVVGELTLDEAIRQFEDENRNGMLPVTEYRLFTEELSQ